MKSMLKSKLVTTGFSLVACDISLAYCKMQENEL